MSNLEKNVDADSFDIDNMSVTHYAYDQLGRMIQETVFRYKPKDQPKPEPEIYALDAVFVESGQTAPEGYVILHKDHYTSKGVWFSKLPEGVITK